MINFRTKILCFMILSLATKAYAMKENCAWEQTWQKGKMIGSGSYGKAYLAKHMSQSGSFVLKEQVKDKTFLKEVRVYSDLKTKDFKSIPKVFAVWTCKNQGFLVMEPLVGCFEDQEISELFLERFEKSLKLILLKLT